MNKETAGDTHMYIVLRVGLGLEWQGGMMHHRQQGQAEYTWVSKGTQEAVETVAQQ